MFGQQVISSSGGSLQNGSQMDFTIGETVIETLGSTTYLTQGFHQTEIGIVNIADETQGQVKLFPNPANASVTIELVNLNFDNSKIEVYDSSGRIVSQETARFPRTTIDVAHLSNGMYFIRIEKEMSILISQIQITH